MSETNRKLSGQQQKLLSRLYDIYERKLYRVAFSILRCEAQSEDAVHEAFVKIIPYLSGISDPEDAKTRILLVNAVKQTAIDQYRRNKKSYTVPDSDPVIANQTAELLPVKSAENREYIRQLLGKMTEKDREIIRYRCFYELSYQEIAAILEISEEAAKKRYQRARDFIRQEAGGTRYE